jgi:hypothetical protein
MISPAGFALVGFAGDAEIGPAGRSLALEDRLVTGGSALGLLHHSRDSRGLSSPWRALVWAPQPCPFLPLVAGANSGASVTDQPGGIALLRKTRFRTGLPAGHAMWNARGGALER